MALGWILFWKHILDGKKSDRFFHTTICSSGHIFNKPCGNMQKNIANQIFKRFFYYITNPNPPRNWTSFNLYNQTNVGYKKQRIICSKSIKFHFKHLRLLLNFKIQEWSFLKTPQIVSLQYFSYHKYCEVFCDNLGKE